MKTAVMVLAALVSLSAAQPYFFESTSQVSGYFNWGSAFVPHQWYRYAETQLWMGWTRDLAHPTYLNVIAACSQDSGHSTFDAYISTSAMVSQNTPPDSWDYRRGLWWNWHTMTGGHLVGHFVSPVGDSGWALYSFNVESWIQSNPSAAYYIVLDQQDDGWDACVMDVWLGPRGVPGMEGREKPAQRRSPGLTSRPNPARVSTSIQYDLPQRDLVSVNLYDNQGTLVRSLVSGASQMAGRHAIRWDGTGSTGARLPAGTYYYRVEATGEVATGKVVLQN